MWKLLNIKNKKFAEISWVQSHIVRAPLARILGLTELVSEKLDDIDSQKVIMYLQKSAEELDGVIKEISNKIDSNNFKC